MILWDQKTNTVTIVNKGTNNPAPLGDQIQAAADDAWLEHIKDHPTAPTDELSKAVFSVAFCRGFNFGSKVQRGLSFSKFFNGE